MSLNKRRRIKPFARPTSFDFNVRYDIQHYQSVKYNRTRNPAFPPTQADSAMAVMEGEILVKKGANAQYTNSQLHVFSFVNGLAGVQNESGGVPFERDAVTGALTADSRNRAADVLKAVKYMGVAVTGFNPGSDQYQQGFVATIAGLNTLFNNGQHTLYPGDTLCMDVPPFKQGNRQSRALQGGVPREKIQFVLTSKDKFDLKYQGTDINAADYIVGTCISYARPGDSVDVILHRVNHTIENAGGANGAGAARPPAFGPGTTALKPSPVDAAVGEPNSSKKSKKR